MQVLQNSSYALFHPHVGAIIALQPHFSPPTQSASRIVQVGRTATRMGLGRRCIIESYAMQGELRDITLVSQASSDATWNRKFDLPRVSKDCQNQCSRSLQHETDELVLSRCPAPTSLLKQISPTHVHRPVCGQISKTARPTTQGHEHPINTAWEPKTKRSLGSCRCFIPAVQSQGDGQCAILPASILEPRLGQNPTRTI